MNLDLEFEEDDDNYYHDNSHLDGTSYVPALFYEVKYRLWAWRGPPSMARVLGLGTKKAWASIIWWVTPNRNGKVECRGSNLSMNWLHLGVSKVPSRGVLICVCQFPFRRKENCNSLVLKHGVVFQQVEKELLDVTYIYPPRVCMKMCPPLLSSEKPEVLLQTRRPTWVPGGTLLRHGQKSTSASTWACESQTLVGRWWSGCNWRLTAGN